MQEGWLNHPLAACYQRSDSMQRRWGKCMKKRLNPCDIMFLSSSSFKQLIIEDPLRQHDDKNRMLRFLSYCSSMTDRRACWIWENLQSGTKITNVWYESCWHIFTVKSSWVLHTWSVAGMDWHKTDGSSGQAIIFAPVRSIILLPISESFHSMLVYLKMHGLLLWDKPTTWYTHFA